MGQVLSEAKNGPMTNWPRLTEVTARPTSSTIPQYSCPIGVGCETALMPRYGHRSDPHTHVAEILMMASDGFMIVGVSRSSKRTSRGPYKIAPRMIFLLVFSSTESLCFKVSDI